MLSQDDADVSFVGEKIEFFTHAGETGFPILTWESLAKFSQNEWRVDPSAEQDSKL